jgi:hypothetical protein
MRFMEIHLSAAMLQKPYSTVEIAEMYRQFCWKPEGQRVAVSNGHCTSGEMMTRNARLASLKLGNWTASTECH